MPKVKVVIGAFVAVLSLSAVASSVASAATAGWMVNGTLLSGSKALATSAQIEENAVLTFEGVTVTCTGLNSVAPQITAPNKGSATSLAFTGCEGKPPCTIDTKTIASSRVLEEGTLEGALGIKVVYTVDVSKKLFWSIKFLGASCSVGGETLPVTGQITVSAPRAQDEAADQLDILNVTEASEELKVGNSNASLKGKVIFRLASGEPWSFL